MSDDDRGNKYGRCDIVKDSGKSRRCVLGWSIVEQLSLRIDS